MYAQLRDSITRAFNAYANATTDSERLLARQILEDAHGLLADGLWFWSEN